MAFETGPASQNLSFLLDLRQILRTMETTSTSKSSKGMDWILFLVFLVIFVLMLMYVDEFFWVPMPFMLTYLVKALDSM